MIVAILKNRRKLVGQTRLNSKPAFNDACSIRLTTQQRDPIVVEIADVFIRNVVNALLQIALDPGMLRLLDLFQKDVFDAPARTTVAIPKPHLPQPLQRLDANRRLVCIGCRGERFSDTRTLREGCKMLGKHARRTPACTLVALCQRLFKRQGGCPGVARIDLSNGPGCGALHELARIIETRDEKPQIQRICNTAHRLNSGLPDVGVVRLCCFFEAVRTCCPGIVELFEQHRRIFRERCQNRRIPALCACRGCRKVCAHRQHRHLCFTEWRAEIFIRLQRIHPAAKVPLALQQILQAFVHLRILTRHASSMQSPQRVSCLEFNLWLFAAKAHRPLPARPLCFQNSRGVFGDERGILYAIHVCEGQCLVAEVDHVFDFAPGDEICQLRILIRNPRIPGHFMRADEWRVAVGFVVGQFVAISIVDLQILVDTVVNGLAPLARDLRLKDAEQRRHAAKHVGRRRDHSRPDCAFLLKPIKRSWIVVKALGHKLQLLSLHNRISIANRVQLRALCEVCGMAGDAQRRLLMQARHAIIDAATARRVGMPRIAGSHRKIHCRAHRILRICVRRRVVDAGPQLVFRMVGAYANVISAALFEHACGELVACHRLHFMRQCDRIFTFKIDDRLAVRIDSIDRNIHRQMVAFHQLDLKEDQLRLGFCELKTIPILFAHQIFRPRALKRQIGIFIRRCEQRRSQSDRVGLLPAIVRLALHSGSGRPTKHLQLKRRSFAIQRNLQQSI